MRKSKSFFSLWFFYTQPKDPNNGDEKINQNNRRAVFVSNALLLHCWIVVFEFGSFLVCSQAREMWSFLSHYWCLSLVYQSLSLSLTIPFFSHCLPLASNTVCPACSRETCPLSPLLLHSHRQPHSLGRLSVNLTEKKKKRSGADTDGSIILKLAENKVELKSGLKRGPQMNRSACHLVSLSLSVCVGALFFGCVASQK